MSKESLDRILATTQAKIPTLKSTEEIWSLFLRFLSAVAVDTAETVFVASFRHGDAAIETA